MRAGVEWRHARSLWAAFRRPVFRPHEGQFGFRGRAVWGTLLVLDVKVCPVQADKHVGERAGEKQVDLAEKHGKGEDGKQVAIGGFDGCDAKNCVVIVREESAFRVQDIVHDPWAEGHVVHVVEQCEAKAKDHGKPVAGGGVDYDAENLCVWRRPDAEEFIVALVAECKHGEQDNGDEQHGCRDPALVVKEF
eukprot:2666562-Rhodomonas_salina.1